MGFPTLRGTSYLLAALFGTVAVGATAAIAPEVALGTAGLVVALLALSHSTGRLLVITVGGLLVLQDSQGLNAAKVAYFFSILLSWMIAFAGLTRRDDAWAVPFRRLLLGSSAVLGIVLVSAPIALVNGAQFTDWARDATPYAMLAMLPIVGIDCACKVSSRVLVGLLGAVGVIAALGFAVDWIGRRGVSALAVEKFSLASFALIAAAFSFAIVRAARGPGRGRWFAVAGVAMVAALLSGGRTSLVLLAGFPGIAGNPKQWRVPIRAVVGVFAALVFCAALLAPFVESQVSSDPAFLTQRVSLAVAFLQGGPTDASYAARVSEYEEAWSQVIAHPISGTGPGFIYPPSYYYPLPGFTLDSPLTTPAKFGLLGTGIILFFLSQLASTARATRRLIGATDVGTAIRAFGFMFVLDLPFGGFLEDKGFSIALMLFLGILAAVTRERLAGMRQIQTRDLAAVRQIQTVAKDAAGSVGSEPAPATV
jgi:hypothetical protein